MVKTAFRQLAIVAVVSRGLWLNGGMFLPGSLGIESFRFIVSSKLSDVNGTTLAAVARRAGVSSSTASLVFSGSGPVAERTRERVLAAARELNYPGPDPRARSLRRGRSGIVGIVTLQRLRDTFRDPIKIALLGGITEEIAAMNAGLLLLTTDNDSPTRIEDAPLDALVVMGFESRLAPALDRVRQRNVPVVSIEGVPDEGIVTIGQDNRVATRTAAEHLYGLGHRDVAIVALPLTVGDHHGLLRNEPDRPSASTTAVDRLAGARDIFPHAIVWSTRGSLVEEGRLAAHSLLADPARRPTAIIAQSDLLAAGVIRGAEECGLSVPQQLSVIGFDGVRVEGLWPYDLTTLVQPAVDKGRAAGRALVAMLEGHTPESTIFPSVFRLGNTTARVPPSPQG